MFYPFFDPTIIVLIPALLFSMWAQFKVKEMCIRDSLSTVSIILYEKDKNSGRAPLRQQGNCSPRGEQFKILSPSGDCRVEREAKRACP